jgi:translation initiation factor 2A
MYQYPNLSGGGAVLANKSFYKADTVNMKWDTQGRGVLVLTGTDVDKTGASYYGEQGLYYLSVKGEGYRVNLDKAGPVYSIEWSPSSFEFCVIYGFMPSKGAVFNSQCEMVHDMGITHRNTALYNPQGNLLCVGGFGNLRGNVEFWDTRKWKVLGKVQVIETLMTLPINA